MAFCVGQTTWSFGALNAFVAVTTLSTMFAMGCASADVEGEPALLKTRMRAQGHEFGGSGWSSTGIE